MKHQPRRKKCLNCNGKKWFPSAIGLISCQMCGGTGKGGIDLDWLVQDWQRLKTLEATLPARRKTIEASIAAEVMAGNKYKEDCERTALAEIEALERLAATPR